MVKFIKGEASLDNDWETYLSEIASMSDVNEMLNYYNSKLAA